VAAVEVRNSLSTTPSLPARINDNSIFRFIADRRHRSPMIFEVRI